MGRFDGRKILGKKFLFPYLQADLCQTFVNADLNIFSDPEL
jgi:hypothetical protein